MTVDCGTIRPAVLAGHFYPADAGALTQFVDGCLAEAECHQAKPKAIIAPHAGFVYSGAIAGSAYASIKALRKRVRRVVLLGPCHRVPVRGFALPSHDAFETPLGRVPVDRDGVAAALQIAGAEQRDDAHLPEHCLETQLPFLQRALGDFSIVPVIVGPTTAEATADLLDTLWGDDETLIVVSSDLSHFYDYDTARTLDSRACQAIERLEPEALEEEQACGRHAIRGLLLRCQALDLRATTLDLRNSGDTAGKTRRDSVVGYGALGFEPAAEACLDEAQRAQLLEVAAQAIAYGLREGTPLAIEPERFPWPLRAHRACFVTLKAKGVLRGCVGSVQPQQALVSDAAQNACKAAFGDQRFKSLDLGEFSALAEDLALSIAILSHPRPLIVASEAEACAALVPGHDGVILSDGEHSALFLPQVWKALPDPRDFLARLKQKAGLPENHWSEGLRLLRFSTESFGTPLSRALSSKH